MRMVVGVLRGGPSNEYDVSLQSGAHVLSALDQQKYDARDIFVDKTGLWHSGGLPVPPERILPHINVLFNVIHGAYGEDGTLQQILDAHGARYTGPGAFCAARAFNKQHTKDALKHLNIKMPLGIIVAPAGRETLESQALAIFRSFVMPVIVKPVVGGSSVGMSVALDFESLKNALARAYDAAPKALVEQFIRGREATVGVIEGFRGEKLYVLPPIEIIPPDGSSFFDYASKYGGNSREICPGNFSGEEKRELAKLARLAHEALELNHYSRIDFIVSPRGIYFLEANSAPAVGLTKESLFPKALAAVGAQPSDFFDHVIELALSR